jgi:hypothetical protein
LVSEARTVLSGMSMDREAAEAAAVASVLAGTATVSSAMDRPVVYAGVCDERLGRSTVRELQFRPTGVGLNRLFGLNSGCLRSSGAWGMGEHSSLEAQDSEFLRDERAVRALGAFEALDSALSGFEGSSSGPGVSSGGSWHDPKVVAGSWHDPKVVAPEGSAWHDPKVLGAFEALDSALSGFEGSSSGPGGWVLA